MCTHSSRQNVKKNSKRQTLLSQVEATPRWSGWHGWAEGMRYSIWNGTWMTTFSHFTCWSRSRVLRRFHIAETMNALVFSNNMYFKKMTKSLIPWSGTGRSFTANCPKLSKFQIQLHAFQANAMIQLHTFAYASEAAFTGLVLMLIKWTTWNARWRFPSE